MDAWNTTLSFLFGAWNGLYSVRNMYGWKMLEDGHFRPIFGGKLAGFVSGRVGPRITFLAKPSLPYWGQEWTPQTPKSCRFVGTLGVSSLREIKEPWFEGKKVPSFKCIRDILYKWWFHFFYFHPYLGKILIWTQTSSFSFFFGASLRLCWTFRRHKKKPRNKTIH